MNDNRTASDRDNGLQTFVAELTDAAYAVALLHKHHGSWIDLELNLWRALGDKVQQWQRHPTPGRQSA